MARRGTARTVSIDIIAVDSPAAVKIRDIGGGRQAGGAKHGRRNKRRQKPVAFHQPIWLRRRPESGLIID
jgi:hypothetical protein